MGTSAGAKKAWDSRSRKTPPTRRAPKLNATSMINSKGQTMLRDSDGVYRTSTASRAHGDLSKLLRKK